MHDLLEQQIERIFGSKDGVPEALRPFLELVERCYRQADDDRRRLERRVDELGATLDRAEARYEELFETSRDAVLITTAQGRLLDINPAGVELLGGESRERTLAAIDNVRDLYADPADRDELVSRLRETGFVRDVELEVRRLDGSRLTVLSTINARRDADGRIHRLRGIVRDVTRRRELERQLGEAQKMEAVGRLAGGIAHDFNNLLTAIIGYGDLLHESLPADDPLQHPVEEVRRAAGRGADLVRQLLAFSRRQVLRPAVIDLNEVAAEMEGLLRQVVGESCELRLELASGLGSTRADPVQIEQVILNLVLNARDAMPEGGVVRLATSNREGAGGEGASAGGPDGGSWVVLEVSDGGVGIEESIREQIFEPFFTTKADGGTGLGLASVYGIVRQSDGRIEVDSAPGAGSTFRILLPRVAARPRREGPPEPRGATPGGEETVLLVEDDPVVLAFVSHYLRNQGYTVLEASDGEQALEVAESRDGVIDLLLTDVVMPRMNGIELVERMTRLMPSLRVLLVSGYTGRRLAEEGGPEVVRRCHFLPKPFAAERLGRKIREILGAPVEPDREARLAGGRR